MTREHLDQIRTLAENEPREHIRTIVTSLCDELLKTWDERDALAARGDELRQTIVNLTSSTPYPEEAEENRQRVGVLLAEIGTLKAAEAGLREQIGIWVSEANTQRLRANKAEAESAEWRESGAVRRGHTSKPTDCNGRLVRVGDKVRSTSNLSYEPREGVVVAVSPTGLCGGLPLPNCISVQEDGSENGPSTAAAFLWEVVE